VGTGLAVIDGKAAYVGGIDLTSLAGDRLDSFEHRARGDIGWHDGRRGSRGLSSPTWRITSRSAGSR
jgi:hypothetical protein